MVAAFGTSLDTSFTLLLGDASGLENTVVVMFDDRRRKNM